MRPSRWLLAALCLTLLAAAAPASAQGRPPRNNLVLANINGPSYPEPLLSEEEVARIERLQTGALGLAPLSPLSPDDQAVLIGAGEEIGFLNIADGGSVLLDPERFDPYLPLPLLGATSFSWLDERTLGALGLNFLAQSPEEIFVLLLIDRFSAEVRAEPLRVPANTSLLSVSPDFRKLLLVRLPEEPGEGSGEEPPGGEARIRLGAPTPPGWRSERPDLPAAFQRRFDRMARERPQLLDRARLLFQEEEDGALEVTVQTLDILTYDVRSRALGYVTTVSEASSLLGQTWSDDSSRVALSLLSLSEVDAERPPYDGALFSELLYRDVTGNLPPDQNPVLQGGNTYIVDLGSGAVQLLRSSSGDPALLAAEDWSPDGRTLLVKAYTPAALAGRRYPLFTYVFSGGVSYRFYDAAGRETGRFSGPLFGGGGEALPVGFFLSPDELIFRGAVGTDRHPYYYNRVSGELRNIADRAGYYYGILPLNRSRQLFYGFSSFTDPGDFYRMGWDGKGVARITWLNEELRQEAALRQDPVSFRLRNGQLRRGVLIQPAGAAFPPRNVPLVVWQEGGPGPAMFNRWLSNVENPYALLPSFDFALLVVPLSGRAGYNQATYNALADRSNFGSIDVDEMAEIVGQAIAQGWTQRGRVGVTGCSYGGYFAWQSVIRHPDLYAAANPQCALVDTITEWTRGFSITMPYLQGLPPYVAQAEYRADSPAYNAGRVRAAVLTFHGSEDFLPVVQNENLHLQLVNRGVPARMVKFIGEGHGLGDPTNQLYAAQEQISWFRSYLK